jgi:hypothetical protein
MNIDLKAPLPKVESKVSVYLLEAWYDGANGVAYDSGRTIEVSKIQADALISIGTAQAVEEES